MYLVIFKDSNICTDKSDQEIILSSRRTKFSNTLFSNVTNSKNAYIAQVDSVPEDFVSQKYIYTEQNGFELNPEWVDPDAPVVEEQ